MEGRDIAKEKGRDGRREGEREVKGSTGWEVKR